MLDTVLLTILLTPVMPEAQQDNKPEALPKSYLHQLYHAQRDYREQHERWAPDLQALFAFQPELESDHTSLMEWGILEELSFQTAEDGYQITARARFPGDEDQIWHIRQDSRIWRD